MYHPEYLFVPNSNIIKFTLDKLFKLRRCRFNFQTSHACSPPNMGHLPLHSKTKNSRFLLKCFYSTRIYKCIELAQNLAKRTTLRAYLEILALAEDKCRNRWLKNVCQERKVVKFFQKVMNKLQRPDYET